MSSYLTLQDVVSSLTRQTIVQLTNEDYSATEIDSSIIDVVIKSQSELIDGYLRGRYDVPLPNPPTIIKDIALDLVKYALYKRRPESKMPETIEADRKFAIKQLEDIRDSKIHLGIEKDDTLPDEPTNWRVRASEKVDTTGY